MSLAQEGNAPVLMKQSQSNSQKWEIRSVLEVSSGLAGWMLVNAESLEAVAFVEAGKSLTMLPTRDVKPEMLWGLTWDSNAAFCTIASLFDTGQVVDHYAKDGCAELAMIQAHGKNGSSHQKWILRQTS